MLNITAHVYTKLPTAPHIRKRYFYIWQLIVCLTNPLFEERIQHGFPHLCGRSTPSAFKNTDGISRTFFSSLYRTDCAEDPVSAPVGCRCSFTRC